MLRCIYSKDRGIFIFIHISLTDHEVGGTTILRNFYSYCQSTRCTLAQCVPTPLLTCQSTNVYNTMGQNPFQKFITPRLANSMYFMKPEY